MGRGSNECIAAIHRALKQQGKRLMEHVLMLVITFLGCLGIAYLEGWFMLFARGK
jgi:hypothetical protein